MDQHNYAIGLLYRDHWDVYVGNYKDVENEIFFKPHRGYVEYYKDMDELEIQLEYYREEMNCTIHRT